MTRPFSEIRRHPYRPLRGARRLLFQLRLRWRHRGKRTCWMCEGSGSYIAAIWTNAVRVDVCPRCEGRGWI